jgi:hypothetical protein
VIVNRKWIAIDLALLMLTGLLGWRLSVSVARFNDENNIAKLQPARDIKQQIQIENGLAPHRPRRNPNPEEFGIVPAQNLFAESRSMQKELEQPVVEVAPKLAVRPVLVGVTISADQRLASIIETATQVQGAQGAGRRAQTKRLGDVIQGYTIVDITDSQMVLAYGNQREIIPLYDTTKPKGQGGKTPIVATRVVNIGPGGGGTGARPVVTQGSAQAAGATPAGTPSSTPSVVTVDRPGAQSTVIAGQQSGARQNVQPGRANPGVSQQQQPTPPAWNEGVDAQGRRIIKTPFGDIVRDKPPNNPSP